MIDRFLWLKYLYNQNNFLLFILVLVIKLQVLYMLEVQIFNCEVENCPSK